MVDISGTARKLFLLGSSQLEINILQNLDNGLNIFWWRGDKNLRKIC